MLPIYEQYLAVVQFYVTLEFCIHRTLCSHLSVLLSIFIELGQKVNNCIYVLLCNPTQMQPSAFLSVISTSYSTAISTSGFTSV